MQNTVNIFIARIWLHYYYYYYYYYYYHHHHL